MLPDYPRLKKPDKNWFYVSLLNIFPRNSTFQPKFIDWCSQTGSFKFLGFNEIIINNENDTTNNVEMVFKFINYFL